MTYLLTKEDLLDLWNKAWIEAKTFDDSINQTEVSKRNDLFEKYLKDLELKEGNDMLRPRFVLYGDAIDTSKEQPKEVIEDNNNDENQSTVQSEEDSK